MRQCSVSGISFQSGVADLPDEPADRYIGDVGPAGKHLRRRQIRSSTLLIAASGRNGEELEGPLRGWYPANLP